MAIAALNKTYKKTAAGGYAQAGSGGTSGVNGFNPASSAGIQAGQNATSGYYGGGLSTGTTGGAAPTGWNPNMSNRGPLSPPRATAPGGAPTGAGQPAPGGAPAPTGGSQSGPGILENWFNQRANGTDPAYEYGTGRAADQINRNYAARGGYNSSAAMQSLGDMYSNSNAQRMSQLDALAGGASGEHQRRLEDMFNEGQGIAGGQAGVAGAYDQAAGGAMGDAFKTQMELMLGRAGVDQKTRQGQLNFVTDTAGAVAGGLGYNKRK